MACRASGKLANLSVHSMASACITHRQGNLTVEVRAALCTSCRVFCTLTQRLRGYLCLRCRSLLHVAS